MKKWVDTRRRPHKFQAGDKVPIKPHLEQFWFCGQGDQHLVQTYDGPMEVIDTFYYCFHRILVSLYFYCK